jgi:small subunit ribosomal protein S17
MTAEKTTTTEQTGQLRRTFTGTVVSDAMDKTIVVAVERRLRHKLYGKLYTRTRKFPVHDPENRYKAGDIVKFEECRPLSKTKRWRVVYGDSASDQAATTVTE